MRRSLAAASVVALISSAVTVLIAQVPGRGAPGGRAGGRGAEVALPDGPGKDMVQANCATCHALTNITNSRGYATAEWDELTSSMILLPAEMKTPMMTYLGTHFPRKPGPAPVVIAGPVNATIREWVVPTLGSRPHDPAAAADGSIWWTGQWANVLGRLDPRTGAMKEFPLKTPNSGPHGLAEDASGNIWYTGNGAGLIGKLDPKSGAVTEYQMPDPAARDPHTPVFAKTGMLWFSVQQGNMMGPARPADRQHQARHDADAALTALRRRVRFEGPPVRGPVRHEQDRQPRSDHDGGEGVHVAERREPAAPPRHHGRRHDLVRGLLARVSAG